MVIVRYLPLLCYFLLISNVAYAQNTPISQNTSDKKPFTPCKQPLSLSELTQISLTHNPNTRLAVAQFNLATANLELAQSHYWPQINLNFPLTYGDRNLNKGSNSGHRLSSNPSLSINYILLDFGTRLHNVQAAHYQVFAQQFTNNASIQQVIYDVDQAYYQLLGQQALLKSAIQTLKQTQLSLDSAKALHKEGMATIGDIYQAQSNEAQAELNWQKAKEQVAIAKGQLTVAIGLPIQTSICISPLPQTINVQPVNESLSHLLNVAAQHRPDLLAAKAQVKAAKASLAATQAQAWPTLQLTANTGQTCPTGVLCNFGYQSNVTLSLNIPLFTGFEQRSEEHHAEALQEEAKAKSEKLMNQINLDVWQAYYALQTAVESISASNILLHSSEQAAKQALGQYRAGVGNILNVISTQTAESNARAQNIEAKLNWYLATAQLAQALGTLMEK